MAKFGGKNRISAGCFRRGKTRDKIKTEEEKCESWKMWRGEKIKNWRRIRRKGNAGGRFEGAAKRRMQGYAQWQRKSKARQKPVCQNEECRISDEIAWLKLAGTWLNIYTTEKSTRWRIEKGKTAVIIYDIIREAAGCLRMCWRERVTSRYLSTQKDMHSRAKRSLYFSNKDRKML